MLGLTSGDFESAATAARTRRPCDDGGGAPLSPPPPSNVAVVGGFGSPRITSRRRHGVDCTTASGPAGKPAQKPSATKTIAALLLMPATAAAASADRKSFPHPAVSVSCRTDPNLFGNYGGGSDPDLSPAAAAGTRGDYGGGTSARASTPSTAPATVLTAKKPSSSSEHRGRDRFKKILRPVTRSKSAGASERIPAYALFLRHQHDQQKVTDTSLSSLQWRSHVGG